MNSIKSLTLLLILLSHYVVGMDSDLSMKEIVKQHIGNFKECKQQLDRFKRRELKKYSDDNGNNLVHIAAQSWAENVDEDGIDEHFLDLIDYLTTREVKINACNRYNQTMLNVMHDELEILDRISIYTRFIFGVGLILNSKFEAELNPNRTMADICYHEIRTFPRAVAHLFRCCSRKKTKKI